MKTDDFSNDLAKENNNNPVGRNALILPVLPLFTNIIFPDMITSIQVEKNLFPTLLENLKDGDDIALLLSKSNDHSDLSVKNLPGGRKS